MSAPDLSPAALTFLIAIFIGWHAVLWCIASWLMGRIGGWQSLAGRFPHRDHVEKSAHASGMLMIGERWNGSMTVHAEKRGLAVAAAPLLRVGHAPILLPWVNIKKLPDTPSPVVRSTHVEVSGEHLSFYGDAAAFVATALADRTVRSA